MKSSFFQHLCHTPKNIYKNAAKRGKKKKKGKTKRKSLIQLPGSLLQIYRQISTNSVNILTACTFVSPVKGFTHKASCNERDPASEPTNHKIKQSYGFLTWTERWVGFRIHFKTSKRNPPWREGKPRIASKNTLFWETPLAEVLQSLRYSIAEILWC